MGKTTGGKAAIYKMVDFKRMTGLCDDLPKREFKPLKVKTHPFQKEMDTYRSMPSEYNK